MQALRGILIKTCPTIMHRSCRRGSLLGRSLRNSMHSLSTTPLIAQPWFYFINYKRILQVAWILQWYFGTYANRGFKTLEHLKFLKQSFKIFKSEVSKAKSFKRWNETVFQNFCDTCYWLSKILFKICRY